MNIENIIIKIAQDNFGLETLETRNSDSLDFNDTAVWCIKDALTAAFQAGIEFANNQKKGE